MVNMKQKAAGSVDMNRTPTSEVDELKKTCTDCYTTRTPLWRGGPAGPRTLCNACGIRHRKKRRALLGLNAGGAEKIKKKSRSSNKSKLGLSLKLRLMALGREMGLQRSAGFGKQGKLGEEEQAAILLMAISCGLPCA
ncbi:hypothetical protein L1049_005127 [Liquidambar formosana]|uniref:GATA-type domain-containing protein n=1 Tax=Liquidambar formosana TaxID=63359 RepID=A0AAP0RUQ7_LIQFO